MTLFDSTVTSEQVVAAFAPQVKGRTFVITGAGHPSIGSSIATALAKASPAQILIASRTAANANPVLAAVREIDPSIRTAFVEVDLSDHAAVRRAAQQILDATRSKIDVLINSAGNMALKEYTLDKQGIELQFSVNHVGHFLLTNLLTPAILAAATGNPDVGARVVNLTSAGYQISPVRYADPAFSAGAAYDPWSGYGQAKTAQILFAYGLTERLGGRGVLALACHPGANLDTKLGAHLVMEDYADVAPITKRNTGNEFAFTVGDEPRFKTYEQIGATPLIAALDPELAVAEARGAACYLQNGQVMQPVAEHACGAEHVEKCWKLSEELVGRRFEYED
jgi:NAD(P)-dependent dehydrogenase (short-subunit alcohol dehydrogenase family)